MDLLDVFNQDINRLATGNVSDLQNVQKNSLANQFQGLQNDRYGQVTPYEVAKAKLEGLRAGKMSTPEALDSYAAGTMGQFNTQARADRRDQAVEDAGINPKLIEAKKLAHDEEIRTINEGIDMADNLLHAGHAPQTVVDELTRIYGQLPNEISAMILAPNAKQTLGEFRRHVALTSAKHLQKMAELGETGRWHVASTKAGGDAQVRAYEIREKEYERKLADGKVKAAENSLNHYKQTTNPSDPNYARDVATLTQALETAKTAYNNLGKPSGTVRQYNPATGEVK